MEPRPFRLPSDPAHTVSPKTINSQPLHIPRLTEAEQRPEAREQKVVPLPARPPAGRVQQVQQEAAQVHPRVAQQKKHRNDGGDKVQVPNEAAERAQQERDADRAVRLGGLLGLDEVEDGENFVVGDGGQERGRAREALEGRAESREGDAHGDDGGDGPRHGGG
jgi:hypothetical protein